MSRNKSLKNDWRRYRKSEQENEKLRKEIGKLRKVINNLVVDQLEKQALKIDDRDASYSPKCEICGNEDLHSVPINRSDGEFEIRICKTCTHRHPMKKKKSENSR